MINDARTRDASESNTRSHGLRRRVLASQPIMFAWMEEFLGEEIEFEEIMFQGSLIAFGFLVFSRFAAANEAATIPISPRLAISRSALAFALLRNASLQ